MNSRLAVVLALSLAAVACSPKVSKEKAPGADDPAYMFPHSTHLDAEVDCKLCHPMEKATKLQTGVRHVQLPKNPAKNAACQDCHDTDVEFPAPERARPFRLSFSHAEHLPRVNGDCKRCHPKPPESGDATAQTPPMETCTSCHTHQQDFLQAQCKPCHLDLKGYAPQTAFKHQGDWLRSHGSLARPSAETCASCHDQTYCAECHAPQTTAARPSIIFPERVDRAFIHRGDYVSRHMIEAGANPASCRRCHGSAFCQACHVQQGLNAALGQGTRWPESHDEPNWVIPATSGGRPAHAPAAKRDISSCAACHDGGGSASCVGCHQVGGIANPTPGTNGPHPSSFVRKHRGEEKDGMCRQCHRT